MNLAGRLAASAPLLFKMYGHAVNKLSIYWLFIDYIISKRGEDLIATSEEAQSLGVFRKVL